MQHQTQPKPARSIFRGTNAMCIRSLTKGQGMKDHKGQIYYGGYGKGKVFLPFVRVR